LWTFLITALGLFLAEGQPSEGGEEGKRCCVVVAREGGRRGERRRGETWWGRPERGIGGPVVLGSSSVVILGMVYP